MADAHDGSFAEISPPDAMLELMKEDDVLAYKVVNPFWDTGNPQGWLKACNDLVD